MINTKYYNKKSTMTIVRGKIIRPIVIIVTIILSVSDFHSHALSKEKQRQLIGQADSLYRLSEVQNIDPQRAIALLTKSTEILQSADDSEKSVWIKAHAKNRLAYLYTQINRIEDAIQNQYEAAILFESIGNNYRKNQIQAFTNLAKLYSFKSANDSSIKYAEKTLDISRKTKDNDIIAKTATTLAQYYYDNKQYDKATQTELQAFDILRKQINKSQNKYLESIIDIVRYATLNADIAQAIQYAEKTIDFFKKYPNQQLQASTYNNIANIFFTAKQYDEAIDFETLSDNIRRQIFEITDPKYIISLENLIIYNHDTRNYEEMLRLKTDLLDIKEQTLGKTNSEYIDLLYSVANDNLNLDNKEQALKLAYIGLSINESIYGESDPKYAVALEAVAKIQAKTLQYHEAVNTQNDAVAILKNAGDKYLTDYISALNDLAYYSYGAKKYNESLRLTSEAMKLYPDPQGTDIENYIMCMQNMSLYNFVLGYKSEALRWEEDAFKLKYKHTNEISRDYAIALNKLGERHIQTGGYAQALDLLTRALNVLLQIDKRKDASYRNILSNIAICKADLNNIDEAIRTGNEILDLIGVPTDDNSAEYATILTNLSSFHTINGDNEKAIALGKQALDIRRKQIDKQPLLYATQLNNLAEMYYTNGNFDKAIEHINEVLEIKEKHYGTTEHPSYATSLSNRAIYQYAAGNIETAFNDADNAIKIKERTVGKNAAEYINALRTITLMNYNSGNVDALSNNAIESTSLKIKQIRNQFINLTAEERNRFWNNSRSWFENEILQFAIKYPTKQLLESAYGSTLFAKGLTLNSEIELKNLIAESGNQEAQEVYTNLHLTRLQLDEQYALPTNSRTINVDSLEQISTQLERHLMNISREFGDYTSNLSITPDIIKQHLDSTDVAIEFVKFPDIDSNDYTYAAFVMKNGYDEPKMIRICNENAIKAYATYNQHLNFQLSELIWGPLESELQGVGKIYFAPVGELYIIPIEMLPLQNESQTIISDRYIMYRLSSTRELAVKHKYVPSDKAFVYGGLMYDTDADVLIASSERYSLRNGIQYLEGTKEEALNINRILTEKMHINSTVLTDTTGTESSFKAISGQPVNLIHIATHGFYLTEYEARRHKINNAINMLAEYRHAEDKTLLRSGLMFAGANITYRGQTLPDDVDDGILTAKEIAELDLRGLELVVLSACQTGLGDITGDGVFGLQRGFKKAGVQSLLMSLWKVDDKATQMLMTEFYSNWATGMDKHEALRKAQSYVRDYSETETISSATANEHPFADPKYWAAFILLDALN